MKKAMRFLLTLQILVYTAITSALADIIAPPFPGQDPYSPVPAPNPVPAPAPVPAPQPVVPQPVLPDPVVPQTPVSPPAASQTSFLPWALAAALVLLAAVVLLRLTLSRRRGASVGKENSI